MTFVDGLDTFDIAPVVVPVKSMTLNGTRTKSSIIGAVLVSRDGIVGKILLLTIQKVFKSEGITQEGHVTSEEFKGNKLNGVSNALYIKSGTVNMNTSTNGKIIFDDKIASSSIDKAASKGLIHANKASRDKARLAAKLG